MATTKPKSNKKAPPPTNASKQNRTKPGRGLKTTLQKRAWIDALNKTMGNVTAAANAYGLNRRQFYDYMANDPEFAAEVNELKTVQEDFIESQLMTKIKEGDTACIIFAAKTRLRGRGYQETVVNNVNLDEQTREVFRIGGKEVVFGT